MKIESLTSIAPRLRKPENIKLITEIVKRVSYNSGFSARDILEQPIINSRILISRLRGKVGMEMLGFGFKTRDVAELFNQSFHTTDQQIKKQQLILIKEDS